MVSSKLSHRRGYLKRPKVCKPSPPAPVPPALWVSCSLVPLDDEVNVTDEVEVQVYCDQEDLDTGTLVPVAASVTAGTWFDHDHCPSGPEPLEKTYTAPEDPGLVTLTCDFTFPNSQTCHAETQILVIED